MSARDRDCGTKRERPFLVFGQPHGVSGINFVSEIQCGRIEEQNDDRRECLDVQSQNDNISDSTPQNVVP